ncbi:MAG: M23 family metallopeptidase [Mariprofundaceae bacterium]
MNLPRFALLAALLLVLPPAAEAAEWRAVQGGMAHVRLAVATADAPDLKAFGKGWPVRRAHDGWEGWIGIDLAAAPGRHAVLWRDARGVLLRRDALIVEKGRFRISRIKVERRMAEFDAATLARVRREARAIRACYRANVADAQPPVRMAMMPAKGVISTPFGARRYVNGEARAPHAGVDIAAPEGTPVLAPLAGRVLLVADMYLNGRTVVLGHGNGLVGVFSHLSEISVRQGQWVETGRLLGRVGATGRATGPHLHWGVRFRMARVDPLVLLDPEPRRDDLAVAAAPD